MLRIGAVLLSLWSGLNLLVGLGVTVFILAGNQPPALGFIFTETEIGLPRHPGALGGQGPRAVGEPVHRSAVHVDALVIWQGVMRGVGWAWVGLCAALLPIQAFGFVSDAVFGNKNLVANVVSTFVLVVGLGLSARGCLPSPQPGER